MKYIGGGWTGGVGWMLVVGGKPKVGNTIHKEANSSAMSSVGHRNCHSQPGRTDSRQQQLDITTSLISAHQCPHRLCNGPSWFYRVGKRPPVRLSIAPSMVCLDSARVWLSC